MIEIDDSLQALQNIVGGRIEAFGRMRLSLDGSRVVDAWCNDDGFKVLPLNRLVLLPKFVGEIYGPILLLAADDTTGETYSLAPWELEICLAIVARWPRR